MEPTPLTDFKGDPRFGLDRIRNLKHLIGTEPEYLLERVHLELSKIRSDSDYIYNPNPTETNGPQMG